MPASTLYRDYLYLQANRGTQVKDAVRRRADAASNTMNLQRHSIITDIKGSVMKVTPGFLDFTGYSEEEMVGRKCNFLQGEGTDPSDVLSLRLAMQSQKCATVVILNYRKDGIPFWNILSIKAHFNKKDGAFAWFSGVVIGLIIPPQMRGNPRLCLEDALALISVFSSIPRAVPHVEGWEDDEEASNISRVGEERPSPSLIYQQHINYSELFNGRSQLASGTSKHEFVAETSLPTEKGQFRVRAYRNSTTGAEPLALIVGDIEGQADVICRVHDQCLTSEVFGSLKCDCKQQLDYALEFIQEQKNGVLFYLPQEGRGIGIANKIAAYSLQETGLDTVDANRHLGLPDDAREYSAVQDMLADLRISSVKILTNNPRKISCLESLGVCVSDRIPCICTPNSEFSLNYVQAKAKRMGHMINMSSLSL